MASENQPNLAAFIHESSCCPAVADP